MILDKVMPFLTEEDAEQQLELAKEQQKIFDEMDELPLLKLNEHPEEEPPVIEAQPTDCIDRLQAVLRKTNELSKNIEDRYIASFADNKAGLYADIDEIVDNVQKSDFEKVCKDRMAYNVYLERNGVSNEQTAKLKRDAVESFANCYEYIFSLLRVQLNGLAHYNLDIAPAKNKIQERVALWYEPPVTEEISSIDEALESTLNLSFHYPEKYLQNATKASGKIFDSHVSVTALQQVEFDVTPQKGTPDTTYSVYVDMSAPELKGTENITEFDGAVLDAIVSISRANEHGFFTAKQVATFLLYGDNLYNNNPSKQRVGAVTKSIEKLRHIDIGIDWTEHAKLNKIIPDNDDIRLERKGYFLPVEEAIFYEKVRVLNGYRLITAPPIYEYAESVGQIAQHPSKMLNVPVNLDGQKLIIRDFLLREIGHMKNNPTWNKTIKLDRILAVAGIDNNTVTRKKKSQLVTAIRSMLDYWKKEENIAGYTEAVKAKALQSITIILEKKQK